MWKDDKYLLLYLRFHMSTYICVHTHYANLEKVENMSEFGANSCLSRIKQSKKNILLISWERWFVAGY